MSGQLCRAIAPAEVSAINPHAVKDDGNAPGKSYGRALHTRYIEKMLARIMELDSLPLDQARSPENRVIGSCRDFATLFFSMLRYHGIPSRVRFGFGAYFIPNFNVDHMIAEVWDDKGQRWHLIAPEMSDLHIERYKIPFDTHDVPRDKFIVGGLAEVPNWQGRSRAFRCRTGRDDTGMA